MEPLDFNWGKASGGRKPPGGARLQEASEHQGAYAPRSPDLTRRTLLRAGGIAAAGWLAPVAHLLARAEEQARGREPAQSVILLWLAGGPSQLETFDPQPEPAISGGTVAIKTAVDGISLAEGYERLAEQMEHVSLVRSVVSKEGDHERGTYMVKTGYQPDPTVVHPSIGAICCHELPETLPSGLRTEVPRHVSIFPNQWPGRGGFLGDQFDAFKTFDPVGRVPDVSARVPDERFQKRLADLQVIERAFARGRRRQVEATLHPETVARASVMMTTEQLKAFDVTHEPEELRTAYGDTPFGRGCLAARRLIEVGVRCVEVTLGGWDTHTKNHEGCRELAKTLDPAYATLIQDLVTRGLLARTVVLCCGEFGRTPEINKLAGRDHWPHGFSMALSGGGLRGGQVIGKTDPTGGKEVDKPKKVSDVHATILAALGLDPHKENVSAAQRPIKLAEGDPIAELL